MSLDLQAALRAARHADPESVPELVGVLAEELGARDIVLYLVDFAHYTLQPVPTRNAYGDTPPPEDVATSLAGRAYIDQHATTAPREDGIRVWVPIAEGSDRTGVLALTVPDVTDELLVECENLGLFTGYLIATLARGTDLYHLYRRRRAMTLSASMQWDLLPPLSLKSARLIVAGMLEPAYEVGGDCFDYALNDRFFDLAVIDPVGHGVDSALIAALAIGTYRHDRREGLSLDLVHGHLDSVLASHVDASAFATGLLARIDLANGTLSWTNAGHPPPLLVRGGRVVRQLECVPDLPWGCGLLRRPDKVAITSETLEPGDRILFYTDGVVETHLPGAEPFGVDRLADLVGQHASAQLAPEEIVRQLVRSVLDHQDQDLADDATLVLLEWRGRD